jgi:hypothetical protein
MHQGYQFFCVVADGCSHDAPVFYYLWTSRDIELAAVILRDAPFHAPGAEMERTVRNIGIAAIVVNILLGVSHALLLSIAVEPSRYGNQSQRLKRATWLLIISLAVLFLTAAEVGVSL